MQKNAIKHWLITTAWWVMLTVGYSLVALGNIQLYRNIIEAETIQGDRHLADYLSSHAQMLEGFGFGLIFGTLFYFINRIVSKWGWNKMSFWRIVLLKSLIYIVMICLAAGVIVLGLYFFNIFPYDLIEILTLSPWQIPWTFSLSITTTLFFFILLTNFIEQIARTVGVQQLLPIFLGRYHRPIQEERVFMFIDLKGSTGHAERLGNLPFTRLIQDCLLDLNKVAEKYEAEIYKYVGDEAILTWPAKVGVGQAKALQCYIDFEKQLEGNKAYYEANYQLFPSFKAGAHIGVATVAEIGDIKREISYHGDVVNTAARIQALCNEKQARLLVSDELWNRLNKHQLQAKNIGQNQLKGKKREVMLWQVI